jgi:hypothetical protein
MTLLNLWSWWLMVIDVVAIVFAGVDFALMMMVVMITPFFPFFNTFCFSLLFIGYDRVNTVRQTLFVLRF